MSETSAALEWESRATLVDGRPITYRGISLLEFDGGDVTSIRAYYDSAAFLRTKAEGNR